MDMDIVPRSEAVNACANPLSPCAPFIAVSCFLNNTTTLKLRALMGRECYWEGMHWCHVQEDGLDWRGLVD